MFSPFLRKLFYYLDLEPFLASRWTLKVLTRFICFGSAFLSQKCTKAYICQSIWKKTYFIMFFRGNIYCLVLSKNKKQGLTKTGLDAGHLFHHFILTFLFVFFHIRIITITHSSPIKSRTSSPVWSSLDRGLREPPFSTTQSSHGKYPSILLYNNREYSKS